MDPQRTLRMYRNAKREKRQADAKEHAQAIQEWIASGGFAPRYASLAEEAAVFKCAAQ